MSYSVFKNNNFKSAGIFTVLVLLFLILWQGCTQQPPVPLVQLSPEVNNQFISAGVKNIVFFNEVARPVQILDLTKDNPPKVRQTYNKDIMLESINVGVNQTNLDSFASLLPKEHAKSLLEKKIPYLEYRNEKDEQIQVFELSENGRCLKCEKLALEQHGYPNQSGLLHKTSNQGILDYVIPPVAAACFTCTTCTKRPKPCQNVDNNCCNCK